MRTDGRPFLHGNHDKFLSGPTLASPTASKQYWGKRTDALQTGVTISDGAITGTLKFIEGGLAETGPLAGDGNFLAIKFTAEDWSAYTSVKVGLNPSASGMDPADLLNDPDKDGVFKITDKDAQNLEVYVSDGTTTSTFSYDLSGLICQTE